MHRTLHLATEQLNTSTSQRAARPFGLLQLECAEDVKHGVWPERREKGLTLQPHSTNDPEQAT
jgi:hypothetical protein